MSNSKDYRMSLIQDVENELINQFAPDQVTMISNIILKALSEYEITERCTDLVPLDDVNNKLIKRYRACLMVDGKSDKTIYQYTRTLYRMSDTMKKPFTEMGTYDIRFYLALEQERGISLRSVENTRSNLSAFFQWMLNEELIAKNPLAKIKPVKYHDELKKAFSEVEIDALRTSCKSLKERAIFEMLLSTGVRVSELSMMKVQDINFSDLSVHVVHGKGSKERMTYTTAVSAKHLLQYLNDRQETGDSLFYNHTHETLTVQGIRHILKTIAKRSGVENVHPHRFRRTFATGLAKRGMNVQEIQKLLGHSSIDTTMTYVNVENSGVQASYKKFSA